ncbi:MAG: M14 family zinc carboxypeptidase [Candidatus Sumerlaeia bacterium]|nr:M14 family zinc carboxypeptidase [Candidatus Sumerlaeia bacterium]
MSLRIRTAAALAAFAAVAPVHAQPTAESPYGYAEVRPYGARTAEVLAAADIIADHHDRTDAFPVYLKWEDYEFLSRSGLDVRWSADPALKQWEAMILEDEARGTSSYTTYTQLGQELQAFAAANPDIARVQSIGTSVQGRQLWVIKISDNPDAEEDEPEFRYVSTMHGDEVLGVEVCMDLIGRLLNDYGTDPRITTLVDETEVWIMPLMNPDGRDRTTPTRFNANGVDLNRDFPRWSCSDPNSTAGRQAETAAVMSFFGARSTTLSANMHGGALVANYPYDECFNCLGNCGETLAPDNDIFRDLALLYSTLHVRMFASATFPQGVTNGTDWYPLYGGLQDWTYVWEGGMEITLELDNQKIPTVSRLPGLVQENREPALAYLEMVHHGIRGTVIDGPTGQPLPATIRIDNRNRLTFTDPDAGDFHRVLAPGSYDLLVTAEGYAEPKLVEDVVVTDGPATRVDLVFGEAAATAQGWTLY